MLLKAKRLHGVPAAQFIQSMRQVPKVIRRWVAGRLIPATQLSWSASFAELLRNGSFEHTINLLIRGVDGRLSRLGCRQRLVSRTLSTLGSSGGRTGRSRGRIGRGPSGSHIRLQSADLPLESINVRLQWLKIGAACQSGKHHGDGGRNGES
ncbi:MAG: hypothetical protein WA825_09015 [Steroidobacteraceae bacterium]